MTDHQFEILNEKLSIIFEGILSIVNRLDAQSEATNITVHSQFWNEYTKSFQKFSGEKNEG